MPQAVTEASPDLAIALDVPNREFNPGEPITGRVYRHSHVVSSEALVSIKLYGRTKVRVDYTTNSGNSNHHHTVRSRFELLGSGGPAFYNTIFRGPIHIPPDGSKPAESWPFSFSLPFGPVNPQSICEGAHNKQKHSFLPIDPPDQITSHPLPFTFYTQIGSRYYNGIEAYVEYVLEAEFFEQHTSRFSSSPSAKRTATAVLPITIRPPPIPPLHPDEWRLGRFVKREGVRTQRLIPEFADSEELSFKQKTLKLFHSSKVPKYSFDVLVITPGVIQLGSVEPVPFRVAAVPRLGPADETSDEVKELERTPTVSVVSLRMVVKARTEVKVGNSRIWDRYTDKTDKVVEWSWMWKEGEEGMALPVWDRRMGSNADANAGLGDEEKKEKMALGEKEQFMDEKAALKEEMSSAAGVAGGSGGGGGSSSGGGGPASGPTGEPPARDIGAELGLRFNPTELAYNGGPAKLRALLYPDFMTYNIRRTHELKWEMVLAVAKETVKVSNEQVVRFVAPWT